MDQAATQWSAADVQDYFGPFSSSVHSGEIQIGATSLPLCLHVARYQYTAYDILQTRGRFDNEASLVGFVEMSGEVFPVFGSEIQKQATLIDTELISGNWNRNWDSFIKSLAAANMSKAESNAQNRIVVPISNSLRLELSTARLKRKGIVQPAGEVHFNPSAQIPETGRNSITTWLGTMDNPASHKYDLRLDTLEFAAESGMNRPVVAMMTCWFRDRRLDGAVAESCPWKTRAEFVHTLQDIMSEGVDWYVGKYSEKAQAIVEAHVGIKLEDGEFFKAIEDTFGDRDRALDACCAIPEVRHSPLMHIDTMDEPSLVGTNWFDQEREGEVVRVHAIANRLQVPKPAEAHSMVQMWVSYIPPSREQSLGPYSVSLWRMVSQHDAKAAARSR